MSHLRRVIAGTFLIALSFATLVYAMGGKHPATQPVGTLKEDWPAELPAAINSPARVAGHWVNANDEFFYRGDNQAFRDFLQRLADTKLPLTLVLHTNAQRRSLLWDEEPRLAYDWSLLVGTAGWVLTQWNLNFDDPNVKYALRVDVWLDGGLTLDAIDLPAGVRLSVDHTPPAATQPTAPEAAD